MTNETIATETTETVGEFPIDELLSDGITNTPPSFVRAILAAASDPAVTSFAGGLPNPISFPQEKLLESMQRVVAERGPEAFQYSVTAGVPELRAWIAERYNHRFGTDYTEEDVLVTTGSQQVLDLLGKVLLDKGNGVIVEKPTYLAAIQAFALQQPVFREVELTEEGLNIDELNEALDAGAKMIYLIPNFQNPTGLTYTAENREQVREVLAGRNIVVVEDDPYGRLRYDGGHQVPLKAMDDSVIYLGTISKMLGPGLRTGWIAAPEAVLARINLVKQGADLCGSAFDQLVVQHYFADVAWQRTLQKFIALYKERRDAMLAALDEFFPPEATWTHPAGGMFLWITLPDYMDTDSMLAEALESGVTYVPGNSFFPDGKTGRNSMRVNFSFETPESITEAIRRLAKVIEERLELYRVFIEAGALPGYDRKDAAMDENATSWKDVIVDSEQNEEAVMQAREGDAEQIEIAEEKVTEAQEAAAE